MRLTGRRVERGIGMSDRLGDENPALGRRIKLEKMRIGRTQSKLEGP